MKPNTCCNYCKYFSPGPYSKIGIGSCANKASTMNLTVLNFAYAYDSCNLIKGTEIFNHYGFESSEHRKEWRNTYDLRLMLKKECNEYKYSKHLVNDLAETINKEIASKILKKEYNKRNGTKD